MLVYKAFERLSSVRAKRSSGCKMLLMSTFFQERYIVIEEQLVDGVHPHGEGHAAVELYSHAWSRAGGSARADRS